MAMFRGGIISAARLSEARRDVNRGDVLPQETVYRLLDAADALHEALDAMGFDVFYSDDGTYRIANGWLSGRGASLGAAFRNACAPKSPDWPTSPTQEGA